MKEYVNRLDVARSHFDWATDPVEVDIAIYELQAAELAVSHYVQERKEEEKEEIV